MPKEKKPVTPFNAMLQLGLGMSSGYLTGIITATIGKYACLAFGAGILVSQVAVQAGCKDINWIRLIRRLCRIEESEEEKSTDATKSFLEVAEKWLSKNSRYFIAAFVGGAFIGIGGGVPSYLIYVKDVILEEVFGKGGGDD